MVRIGRLQDCNASKDVITVSMRDCLERTFVLLN